MYLEMTGLGPFGGQCSGDAIWPEFGCLPELPVAGQGPQTVFAANFG